MLATVKRILVVEDEALVALDIALGLADAGLEAVGPVGHLSQALVLGATERLDGAILDMNLHGEDVFPLARLLAERGIPFVFYTGHGRREDTAETFPEAPLISKPSTVEKLIEAIW